MPTTIDLPSIKAQTWTTTTKYNVSHIISYNLALGASGSDLKLMYEGHPQFQALPTFGAVHGIAIMGLVHRAMSSFLPSFQGQNHVHGEHYLKVVKAYPIPRGIEEVTLRTTARIVDVIARRTGVLVCVDIVTTDDKTDNVICENEWAGFVLKVPTKGANEKQLQRGPRTTLLLTPERTPDAARVHHTSPEQAALYRAASGDLNPLHIDPGTARLAGFPAPILTGTCSLGIAVRHVVEAFCGGDVNLFMSVKCRMSKPVFAALRETVRTEMWRDEGRSAKILFRMVVDSDENGKPGKSKTKVVISHGTVELREEGSRL